MVDRDINGTPFTLLAVVLLRWLTTADRVSFFIRSPTKETAMTCIERMMCEDCISGEMIFTGKILNNGAKALFVHKCNKCGEIGVFSGIYPSKCERHEDDDTD